MSDDGLADAKRIIHCYDVLGHFVEAQISAFFAKQFPGRAGEMKSASAALLQGEKKLEGDLRSVRVAAGSDEIKSLVDSLYLLLNKGILITPDVGKGFYYLDINMIIDAKNEAERVLNPVARRAA